MRSLCVALALFLLAGCGSSGGGSDVALSALPALHLATDGGRPIVSREVYLPGNFSLEEAQGTLEIRGRGNTTWTMPKKPYRLRLTKSAALLGMPASRHWVLLANYADKTLIRNEVAFEFSRSLGAAYAVRSRAVDLYINGAYEGIYQLAEQIRVAPERVDIPEIQKGESDPERITGGYLIEVDARRGEDFCFDAARSGMVFCLQNPEALGEPGWETPRAYLTQYLDTFENALFSERFADPTTGYAAYLDVDSAIHYYLVHELFKTIDGDLKLSAYLIKQRSGKLAFGPLWDFDIAMGNANYDGADDPTGWHIRRAPWFTRLFEDPAFQERVKTRWSQFKEDGKLDGLFTLIDLRARALSQVQARNFQRWDILSTFVWPNRVVTGSYEKEVAAMKIWLHRRIAWMDAEFSR